VRTVLPVKTSCGFHCSEDYKITTPTPVSVRGNLDSNGLDLTGVTGADVSVSSGDISITGATGAVTAKSDSGGLDIKLTQPASVTATAGSGNIKIQVPAGPYEVTTSSGSGGRLKSSVPNTAGAPAKLQAETNSGNVTITTS
jgi:DUF4097 and DUF4098 domain-containing protein YvlB